jgi:ribokinase
MSALSIVVVGSLNADLVTRVDHLPSPGETVTATRFDTHAGGKGANQAHAAAKLGGDVWMLGCVGRDAQGVQLRASLESVGVNVSHVCIDGTAPTGLALIDVAADGQNQIVVVQGANRTFTPDRLDGARDVLSRARVVMLQLEIPLETVHAAARIAHRSGALVILDPAPARSLPDELLRFVDFITPNESELVALTAACEASSDVACRARQLLDRGVAAVLLKAGEQGARLVTADSDRTWRAFDVRAVDTTAAGDAFNGAFAVALTKGRSVDDAGEFACAAAAVAVTRPGAQASMPTLQEVSAMLGRARRRLA